MSKQRFIGDYNLGLKHIRILNPNTLNQIKRVLRLKKGDYVILSNGVGNEAECEIIEMSKNYVEVLRVRTYDNNNEHNKYLTLYCAILKKENFELVAQKTTEIGIHEIVPIITDRTVKQKIKKDRMIKIITEAAEQSGRGRIPLFQDPISFKDAVKSSCDANSVNVLCHASYDNIGSQAIRSERIGIFIGPEGGWSDNELKISALNNFKQIRLGPLILRSETAAIVASYLLSR